MDLTAWFRGIFARRRSRETRQPEDRRIPYMPKTLAGVYVTPDRALQNATVWACVRYLSSTVAQLPWRVMKELPGGGAEFAPMHPVDNLLFWRPNEELSPFQFKETMIAWALLWGNGYAEIVRDGSQRARELWPIHPQRVEVKRDIETDRLVYEVSGDQGGPSLKLKPDEVFHLRGFGDGPVGLSVIEYAAQSIGWAQAAELFGASFFGNGLNMGGFIETAGGLTTDGKQRLYAELERMFRGPRNAHRWSVLDAGMKATKMTAAPDEAQMVETLQFQVETICRWFGVPPHKAMHLLRSTFNNIEHQAIEVVVDSVTPWVCRLEEEANYKLFGRNRMGFYTNLDMRGLLRGDNKSRAEYYKMMREIGAYSVNEILILEGDNPIGKEGDKRTMQQGYTTLEKIGEDPPQPALEPPANQNDAPMEEMDGMDSLAARRIRGAIHALR
jgi:HK97 family phage portal protein